jgi:hypothetical protein
MGVKEIVHSCVRWKWEGDGGSASSDLDCMISKSGGGFTEAQCIDNRPTRSWTSRSS